jgi:protein phosphatase
MAEQAANWKDFFECASLSDIGLRRTNNQDSISIVPAGNELEWYRRGHLFMVADGMGAHAAGELASKLACNGVPHIYFKLADLAAPPALRQAITETNANIHGRGKANAEFQGMGTTCSVLTLLPQGAVVGHVGDSRVYRLRKHRLEQLTFDHSLVWEMGAAGQINSEQVPSYIPKNIITRSLGPHAEVRVDLEGPFPLDVGDTFLLCSDGLSGQVTDEEIGVLLDSLSPSEAVRTLVDLANLRGGPDNISVIVVRVKRPIKLSSANVPSLASETGHGGGPASIHPAVWVIMGVCTLGAAGMALANNLIPAAVCGAAAAGAGLVALIKGLSKGTSIDGQWASTRLGAGPHRSRDCQPTAVSIAPLAQLCDKLKDAAKQEHWTVSWDPFNKSVERATNAVSAQNFTAAVREYGLALSFLMDQIRQQRRRRNGGDSTAIKL